MQLTEKKESQCGCQVLPEGRRVQGEMGEAGGDQATQGLAGPWQQIWLYPNGQVKPLNGAKCHWQWWESRLSIIRFAF